MDKVLLKDLKKQNKYSKFFQNWANQEFKESPDEAKLLENLEVISQNIGMQEGLIIACFDYRNLTLAFFTENIEDIVGYPSSIFRKAGMETSFTMIHPDDRPELFRFQKIVLEAFHQLSLKERNSFEFSYTTRWVHRTTKEIIWMMAKVKPYLIDEKGNFAMDLHIIVRLTTAPKATSYDWNYSYIKDDGDRVMVSKNQPTDTLVKLTKKEKQIVQLILDGFNSNDIADKLSISVNTVSTHRKHVMKKLGARNIADMVKILASYDF